MGWRRRKKKQPDEPRRLPLAVYASMLRGEPVHRALFAAGDLIAVIPAAIPGYRLFIAADGHYAGFPIALPEPDMDPPMTAELLVLDPDRHDRIMHRLRAYQFDGHDPLGAAAVYHEHEITVTATLGHGPTHHVQRPARIWLPGHAMTQLARGGHITPAPGNDWRTRTTQQRRGGPHVPTPGYPNLDAPPDPPRRTPT